MRIPRIKRGYGIAAYHVVSRVAGQDWLLEAEEMKSRLVDLMGRMAIFAGIQVVTYTIMDNHWHALLVVDKDQSVDDGELVRRLAVLYGEREFREIMARWELWEKQGNVQAKAEDQARFRCRMNDVSEFMKTVNQRFTQHYNRCTGRKGVFWESRFKSVLVEGSGEPLATMAAYIDLNAVRAGLVDDPKDYPWCGYGQAVGGNRTAQEGLGLLLASLHQPTDWATVSNVYRMHVYESGRTRRDEAGRVTKPGFTAEQVEKVLSRGGKLSRHELLRCRVRYLSDGVAFGGKAFIEEVFQEFRDRFSAKRTSGARKMHGGDWGGLCTLRELSSPG